MDTHSLIVEYVIEWDWANASLSARHDDNSDFDDANNYRAAVRMPIARNARRCSSTREPAPKIRRSPNVSVLRPIRSSAIRTCGPSESHSVSVTVEQLFGEAAHVRVTGFHDRSRRRNRRLRVRPGRVGFTAVNRMARVSATASKCRCRRTLDCHDATARRLHLPRCAAAASNGGHEDELRRPHYSGRFVVDFAASPDRLTFEVGAAYVGVHDDDDFATFPARRVELDAYTLLHCTARYRLSDRFEVTGRIENATDENYQDVWGYATPGRSAFVGLDVRL